MDPHETRLTLVRLERECQRDPRGYLRRVIGLALLSYAFPSAVALALPVLAGLLVNALAHGRFVSGLFLFGVPLCLVIWAAVKTLAVRTVPSGSFVLGRREAGRFLDMVTALCRAAGAPRLRSVVVTGEHGVRVARTPGAGMVGMHRNHLVIGLPALQSLPAEELMALIACELGHFSRAHGGFSVWVYGLRETWRQLAAELEMQRDPGTYVLRRFAEWYSPVLDMHTHMLARRHEIATDRVAAKLAGVERVAQALVRLQLASGWLDQRFWPRIRASARRDKRPPEHVFAALAQSVAAMTQDPFELQQFLGPPSQNSATAGDPRLSLSERLQALRQPAAPPPPYTRSAAQEFLGQALTEVETALSDAWREQNEQDWEFAHEAAAQERKRLHILDAKRLSGEITRDEAWERATILREEGREADFERAAAEIAALQPPHAAALHALGRALLARGDEKGIALLDRAMEAGESGGYEACLAVQAFLNSRGRSQEAQRYAQKATAFVTLMERARAERQGYSPGDPVEPHGLRQTQLEMIRTQLAVVSQVREAYLVRKRVSHMRDQPVYVMGVYMVRVWWRFPRQQALDLRRVLKREVELPGDWFCVVLDTQTPGFQQRFRNVAGEPVYVRP